MLLLFSLSLFLSQDCNFLSILPLKERLSYNKGGVLIHKIMPGKVPPSLTAKFSGLNQSRRSGKPSIYQSLGLTFSLKSSLVYSGSVLWNSALPDFLDYHPPLKLFKSRYMSYIMRSESVTGWHCMLRWQAELELGTILYFFVSSLILHMQA